MNVTSVTSCDALYDFISIESTQIKSEVKWVFLNVGCIKHHSLSSLYLGCLLSSEVHATLKGIHEGIYGNHTRGHFFSYKVMTQGYLWLHM